MTVRDPYEKFRNIEHLLPPGQSIEKQEEAAEKRKAQQIAAEKERQKHYKTVGQLKEIIKDLPDDVLIKVHDRDWDDFFEVIEISVENNELRLSD